MSTMVYRLAAVEKPWYVEVGGFVRDMPGWAKVAAIAALPVTGAAFVAAGVEVAAVAGVAMGGAALIGAVGLDAPDSETVFRDLGPEEAAAYQDEQARPLAAKINYLRHPKLHSTLIAAPNYQETIVKEQAAQLMAYIRATVLVRRICISISYDETKDLAVDTSWFGVGKSSKVNGEVISDCVYKTPEKPPMPPNLYWMTNFPTVVEGLRQAGEGTAKFKEGFDRNAHLSARAAKGLGVDIRATQQYRLNVLVEFS